MAADKIFLMVDDRRMSLTELKSVAAKARTVYARGCTGLTALPELPKARTVYARGCTGLTALPELPNAAYVDASGCTGLTALPELPKARTVYASGCTGLTGPVARNVDISDSGFRYFCGGCDSRGYLFEGKRSRGEWRVIAGCRNYSIKDARQHWGKDGESNRPDCLALVEKIAAYAASIDASEAVAA